MLPIRADTRLLAGIFDQNYQFELNPTRRYYAYIVTGTATINGNHSQEGDGYAFEQETLLTITNPNSEIILFDLR